MHLPRSPFPALAILLSLVACAAGKARADERPEAMLERGIQLYEEGELAKAEPLLRAAADLKEPKSRARAFLFLGLVQASRKDLGGTRDSLRAALSHDPLVTLARDRVAPDIVAMFDGLRAELSGELHIAGAGAGARVFVDGRETAVLRSALRLPIGLHVVRVAAGDGARSFEAKDVLVHARVPARLEVKYPPVRVAKPTVLVEPLPSPPPSAPRMRRRTWGYLTLGLAAALGVTGAVLGKLAKDDADVIQQHRATGMPIATDRFESLRSSAESGALVANVLFGVAGAAAITGLVLVLTDRKIESRGASWRIVPLPLGASLAVHF